MSVDFLAMQRRDEAETFESSCKITAEGEGSLDDDGVWQGDTTTIYEGACSFLPQQASTRTTESAGQQVEIHPYLVKVPQNTPVERGHVVQITACPDTAAVGGFFTVRAVQLSQWQVSRLLGCEQGVA